MWRPACERTRCECGEISTHALGRAAHSRKEIVDGADPAAQRRPRRSNAVGIGRRPWADEASDRAHREPAQPKERERGADRECRKEATAQDASRDHCDDGAARATPIATNQDDNDERAISEIKRSANLSIPNAVSTENETSSMRACRSTANRAHGRTNAIRPGLVGHPSLDVDVALNDPRRAPIRMQGLRSTTRSSVAALSSSPFPTTPAPPRVLPSHASRYISEPDLTSPRWMIDFDCDRGPVPSPSRIEDHAKAIIERGR